MPLHIALALGAYVLLLLVVGAVAQRRGSRTPEEYFLAGRGLGTAVLFMALFGTNATAFVLVGIPGLAYHEGVGVFGLNATIIALGIPLTFYAVGSPARRLGARLGALTPAELFARRFRSRTVGLTFFLFFSVYTLPYMVTAVHGSAVTLSGVSGGRVPEWVGGAGVLLVALAYTSLGGMRATAWTNVIQGGLFLVFVVTAVTLVAAGMGGPAAAVERVREEAPHLLVRDPREPLFQPGVWASWGMALSLCVVAFPHMLVRLMAARDERSLKTISMLYPPALAVLWLPVVLIGVFGAVLEPGLVGRESDRILSILIAEHSAWLSAFGFLAVLAAVMSTLDAQILTLSSMLTRDVLDPLTGARDGRRDVLAGRVFGAVIAAAVFLLWRASGSSIFSVATVAFSGYVTLVPALFMGVRWRRATSAGMVASILGGNAVYAASLWAGGGLEAARAASWLGLLPVFWGLVGAAATGVVVSLATRPAPHDALRQA